MSSGSDERELRAALERAQAAVRQEQERAELHKQTSEALQETLRQSELRAAERQEQASTTLQALNESERRADQLRAQLAEAQLASGKEARAKLRAPEEGRGTTLLQEVGPPTDSEAPGWRYYALMFCGPMSLICLYGLFQMREPSPGALGLALLFGLPAAVALISVVREWRRWR